MTARTTLDRSMNGVETMTCSSMLLSKRALQEALCDTAQSRRTKEGVPLFLFFSSSYRSEPNLCCAQHWHIERVWSVCQKKDNF